MPEPAKRQRASTGTKGKPTKEPAPPEEHLDISADLSYREAQAALALCLAQLQASDLDIEAMAGLYERAQNYASRCEQLLDRVEQDVMQWDPEQPDAPPQPYQP